MSRRKGSNIVTGQDLISLARDNHQVKTEDWFEALKTAPTIEIIYALSGLRFFSTGHTPQELEALRDSARAMIEQKQTEKMVAQMQKLEDQAAKLQKIAIGVGAVGVFVALGGILSAMGGI